MLICSKTGQRRRRRSCMKKQLNFLIIIFFIAILIRADGHDAQTNASLHSMAWLAFFDHFHRFRDNMIYLFFTDMLRNLPIRYLKMIWNRYLWSVFFWVFFFFCGCLSFIRSFEDEFVCKVFLAISVCILKSITSQMNVYQLNEWCLKMKSNEWCCIGVSHAAFTDDLPFFSYFHAISLWFHAQKPAQNAKCILLDPDYRSSVWIIIRMGRTDARTNKCTHRSRSWNFHVNYQRFLLTQNSMDFAFLMNVST